MICLSVIQDLQFGNFPLDCEIPLRTAVMAKVNCIKYVFKLQMKDGTSKNVAIHARTLRDAHGRRYQNIIPMHWDKMATVASMCFPNYFMRSKKQAVSSEKVTFDTVLLSCGNFMLSTDFQATRRRR